MVFGRYPPFFVWALRIGRSLQGQRDALGPLCHLLRGSKCPMLEVLGSKIH